MFSFIYQLREQFPLCDAPTGFKGKSDFSELDTGLPCSLILEGVQHEWDDQGCADFNENALLYLYGKWDNIFIFFYQKSIVLFIILSASTD